MKAINTNILYFDLEDLSPSFIVRLKYDPRLLNQTDIRNGLKLESKKAFERADVVIFSNSAAQILLKSRF